MKPASRIQANIEILEAVENSRVPMDARIGDYMRHRRYIGSKDRAEIAERAYAMMRGFARVSWWLKKFDVEDTPRHRLITWLMLVEGADEKRIKDLFDGSNYAPEEITPAEAHLVKLIREGKYFGGGLAHKDMPSSAAVECPALYEDKLKAYFGEAFEEEMIALLEGATLDLRVNNFTANKEKAIKALKKDDIEVTETPHSPWGLRCVSKAYLARTKAFTKGWVEIQDEGSQLIAYLCEAKPGMQVLDYCAGGGGKTLALGAAMQRKGRIVAMDNDSKRLERGRDRYKKAGIADIIEVRSLEDEKHRKWVKRQKNKFDIVLTDVPCTGTGTWRRNPDMRWRVIGPSLEELVETQKEILTRAAALVKPGGRLVYATCSLLPDENEAQIEAFLKDHPEFEVKPVPENLGSPYMRLTPHRHNTDGFFAAILLKKGEPESHKEEKS